MNLAKKIRLGTQLVYF